MTYHVKYKMYQYGDPRGIDISARNKTEAYFKAVYEAVPVREQAIPYSAWVVSATARNGNYRKFNTFEGKPY